ncbi:MAG TPA: hypothetical protein VFE03_16030, partial [Caulobacteraceae bacterium]|nr:hypothetical protein [Caulobacteraceae bacterium]
RYLDMPFGEAVGRICKGLGVKPDWAAWAAEPWAQEERRTRPQGSPYAGDADEPPAEAPAKKPPPAVPSEPGPEPHSVAHPEPPWRPPPGPPPNRQMRRAQARMARKRASQNRAPFARAAG